MTNTVTSNDIREAILQEVSRSDGFYHHFHTLKARFGDALDAEVIALANAGEIVLARFDLPRWEAERYSLVADTNGDLFIGAAITAETVARKLWP